MHSISYVNEISKKRMDLIKRFDRFWIVWWMNENSFVRFIVRLVATLEPQSVAASSVDDAAPVGLGLDSTPQLERTLKRIQ